MFYLGYALLGLGFGATNSVYPVTINKSYGPVYAGGIYGVALFGYMIFCTLITPRISAALVASTGGYTAYPAPEDSTLTSVRWLDNSTLLLTTEQAKGYVAWLAKA